MMQKVEQIVAQLHRQDLDLDGVVQKVEEGYVLIEKMRERLAQTKQTIEQLQPKENKVE
jgi:exodeoxyribonuclease VII small subunit